MALLQLVTTIVCFTVISVLYKLCQVRKAETWAYLGGLYTVAAVCSVAGTAWRPGGLYAPAGIVFMAVIAGVAGVMCLVCALRAFEAGGGLSIVMVISRLSLIVPIIFALVFLGERLTLYKVLGLALFVVFILLLNAPESAKEKAGEP